MSAFKNLSRSAWVRVGVIVAGVAALDQLSKQLILENLFEGQVIPVAPFFNIVLTYNRGAAFGLFSGLPDGWRETALLLTTVLAVSAVIYFLFHDYRDDLRGHVALSLILAGALGNIIDRVRLGMVVDFLDVYYGDWHWPAFNVADSAICIGVAMLLLFRPRSAQEG